MSQATPHIDAVRAELLATLSSLRDKDNPMDIERAKAVANVAQVLVDSARVEVDFMKVTDQATSAFFSRPPSVPAISGPTAHNPFPGREG